MSRTWTQGCQLLWWDRAGVDPVEVAADEPVLAVDPTDPPPPTGWTHVADGGYQGDYDYVEASPGVTYTATWTVAGLAPDKDYQVLATWTPDFANASAAPFTLSSEGVPIGGEIVVDQRRLQVDASFDGASWESLGVVHVSGDTLVVTLDATGIGGRVIGDAIRVVQVVPSTSIVYDALGNVLMETNVLGFPTS
jgi:hypothetical protein